MERTRRLTTLVAAMTVLALVASGCGIVTSPTHEAAAVSATPPVLETPAPSPLATPTPMPTPMPVPTGPILRWTPVLASDGAAKVAAKLNGGISAAVAFGDGFVLAGSDSQGQHAVVWYSPDGTNWQAIDTVPGLADGVIGYLVASPDGLLAVGTAQKPDSQCAGDALGCNPISPIRFWASADGRN